MKPVTQTEFGKRGNCWLACIASVLDVPLESVPDVTDLYEANERGEGKSARAIVKHWLMSEHGLYLYHLHAGLVPLVRPRGYHIMSGKGPRGYLHACVGHEGVIVHDPHPDRSGLVEVTEYEVFGPASESIAELHGITLPAQRHPLAFEEAA